MSNSIWFYYLLFSYLIFLFSFSLDIADMFQVAAKLWPTTKGTGTWDLILNCAVQGLEG